MTDWVRRQQVYRGSGGLLNNGSDTWHWSSAGGWTLLSPATSPESTAGGQFFAPHMVYDTARGNVVAYFTFRAQTWIWNGSNWSNASPVHKPNLDGIGTGFTYRGAPSFAYDEDRELAVLFGGADVNALVALGDTWTWDGTDWTQVASTGPSPRENSSMAFDRANGNIVLFGGSGGVPGSDSETWLWNGSAWSQVFPATTPPRRVNHSMGWNGSEVIMYGGFSGSFNLGDTWTWDGTDWTQVSSESEDSCVLPDFRRDHTLVYDDGDGFAVLLGGVLFGASDVSDLWTWGGPGSIADIPHPLPRSTAGGNIMAWDGSQMVLYGGTYNPSESSEDCSASVTLHLESRVALILDP